jgi:hypothetical protein
MMFRSIGRPSRKATIATAVLAALLLLEGWRQFGDFSGPTAAERGIGRPKDGLDSREARAVVHRLPAEMSRWPAQT